VIIVVTGIILHWLLVNLVMVDFLCVRCPVKQLPISVLWLVMTCYVYLVCVL
jgi:hypothetical protein